MHNCHGHQVHLSDPQTITEDSENRITSVGHSHEIEKASQDTAGIVKVVDHTESTDPLEALSANQGRVLAEALREVIHYNKDETINQSLDAALGYLSTRLTASYSTLALAQANAYKHAEASLIYVVNDAEVSKCGLYTIQGGELVKAPWDALSSALTSEPFEVLQQIMTLPADTTVEYQGKTYFSLATLGKAIADGQTEISEIIQTLANTNGLLSRYILTDSGKTQEEVNTETRSELNLKVSSADVDAALALKADKSYTDAQDFSLQLQINQKVTASYVNAALAQFSTVATKFYPTLAEANASIASIEVNQPVQVGEEANGGLWYKATAEATSLIKSPYDPITLSKQLAEDAVASVSRHKLKLISGDFEQGNFGVFPEKVAANNRVRSKESAYFNCKQYRTLSFTAPPGYKIYLIDHLGGKRVLNIGNGWMTGAQTIDLTNVDNLAFIVARTNDEAITPEVLNSIDISLYFLGGEEKFQRRLDSLSLTKNVEMGRSQLRVASFEVTTMMPSNSNLRITTKYPLSVEEGSTVRFTFNDQVYSVAVNEGVEVGQPVTKDNGYSLSSPAKIVLQPTTKKILFTVKRIDNQIVSEEDIDNLNLKISYKPGSALFDTKPFKTSEDVLATDKAITDYLDKTSLYFSELKVSKYTIKRVGVGGGFNWGIPPSGNFTRFGTMDYLTIAPRTQIKITVPSGFSLALRYSEDQNALDYDSGWIEEGQYELVNHRKASYLHIGFRKSDNSATTVEEISEAGFKFEYIQPHALLSAKYSKSSLALGCTLREKIGGMITQAHSGTAYFGAAENSYDAFVHAGKAGFKVIEADLMITADGHFVVSHNVTIDSTYFVNADGSTISTPVNITTLTLEDIRTNYRTKSDQPKYRKPIVTLDEFLDICRRYGAYPRIEIKQWSTQDFTKFKAFVETTRKYFNDNDVQVISFFFGQLQILAMMSDYMLGYLIYEITEAKIQNALKISDRVFIDAEQNYYTTETKALVDKQRLFTSSWTAYNCADMNRMIDLGVNQVGVQDIPPINGRPSGVLSKIWTSGNTYSDCVLPEGVSIVDGEVTLGAGQMLAFQVPYTFDNGALYFDLCVEGDYTFGVWVNGKRIAIAHMKSEDMRNKVFTTFHKQGSVLRWELIADTSCVINNISFKDYQLDI